MLSGTVFTDGFGGGSLSGWSASDAAKFSNQTVIDGGGIARDVLLADGGGGVKTLSRTINTNGADDLHLNISAFQGQFNGSNNAVSANQFEVVDRLYVRVSDGGSNSTELLNDAGIWGDGVDNTGISITSPVSSGWLALPAWAGNANNITVELGFESNLAEEDYFVDRITLATPAAAFDQTFAPGESLADWTLSPANRFGLVTVQDGAGQNQEALLIAGGGSPASKTLERTVDVAGLPDLALEITAFQGVFNGNNNAITATQFEDVDLFRVEGSADGANFVTIYQDSGPFGNGIDDNGPAATTPTSIGPVALPAALQNQSQVTLRITAATSNGSEDIFIQNVKLAPEPVFFNTIENLEDQINALPTATAEQQVRKAFAEWAFADANAKSAAGETALADQILADLLVSLQGSAPSFNTPPSNILPDIPDVNGNPYLADLAAGVTGNQSRLNREFTAADTNNFSWKTAFDLYTLAGAATHPDSPLRNDSAALTATMRHLEFIFGNLPGLGGTGFDFIGSPSMIDAYLAVDAVYGEYLLPVYQDRWEANLKTAIDDAIAGENLITRLTNNETLDSWVNADIRWAEMFALASLVFPQEDYADWATAYVDQVSRSQFPDGGFAYIRDYNESPTYHGANIIALARMAQVLNLPQATDLIRNAYWYYPLSAEPYGTPEHASSASWKQNWNTTLDGGAAYITAVVADSPENLTVSSWGNFSESALLLVASYYDPNFTTPAPVQDNYFIYDQNTQGPRGRFGNWSFVGTATNHENGTRGKQTFVGAMVTDSDVDPSDPGWSLNAGLAAVYPQVKVAPGEILYWQVRNNNNPVRTLTSTTDNDHSATTVLNDLATLTTRYQISSYGNVNDLPWAGQQEWVYTPERMVGLITTESLADQTGYGLQAVVKTVSGRSNWGDEKSWVLNPDGSYNYGDLVIRIHENTFTDVEALDSSTPEGDNVGFFSTTDKSGVLTFRDAASSQDDTLKTYTAGESRYVVVEVHPATSAPTTEITTLTLANGLTGFTFVENGQRVSIIHNPSDNAVSAQTTLPSTDSGELYFSGEQYRPNWASTFDTSSITDYRTPNASGPDRPTFAVTNGVVDTTIPAHQHVVVIQDISATSESVIFTDGFGGGSLSGWSASDASKFSNQTVVDGDGVSRDVLLANGGGGLKTLSRTITTNGADDLHLNLSAFQGEFNGSNAAVGSTQFETVDRLYVRVSDGGSNTADLLVDTGIWGDGIDNTGISVTSPVSSGWLALPAWADNANNITVELGFESNVGAEDYFVDRITLATPAAALDQTFVPGGSLADWTLSPADRFTFATVQDGAGQTQDALLISGGGSSVTKTLQRTVDVAGLSDLALEITAFQGQFNGDNNAITANQFEDADVFRVEGSVDGANFVTIYQDNGPFGNGIDDTGLSTTTPTSIGPVTLPNELQNQNQITLRITVGSNVGSEDVFIQNIKLTPQTSMLAATSVVGRNVFYNGSVFDGGLDINASDDNAIATDKVALLPGETATSANYTSYSQGINGLIIDIAGLSSLQLTRDDFEVRVGNTASVNSWSTGPLISSVFVREGSGVGGSDRVTLAFENGAITNTWVEITVLANGNTGLSADDVFYFGNWVGETGNDGTTSVDGTDRLLVQNNQTSLFDPPVQITSPYDFNRDGVVNGLDRILVLNSQTNIFEKLTLVTPPGVLPGVFN
ncbi:MAG: hypothetical protein AAGH99_05310 [Planctomycetota bacterium]